MYRTESIAEATRRFMEANRKHAVAQARANSAKHALDRLSQNHARFRAERATT